MSSRSVTYLFYVQFDVERFTYNHQMLSVKRQQKVGIFLEAKVLSLLDAGVKSEEGF